mmetsp:Transcript_5379/g.11912  ORF Transcript_5379/g.11912 Transcript_5379/m.11912 type:complete len:161 (-) Transcript_5379:1157-1639(-)
MDVHPQPTSSSSEVKIAGKQPCTIELVDTHKRARMSSGSRTETLESSILPRDSTLEYKIDTNAACSSSTVGVIEALGNCRGQTQKLEACKAVIPHLFDSIDPCLTQVSKNSERIAVVYLISQKNPSSAALRTVSSIPLFRIRVFHQQGRHFQILVILHSF